MTQRRDILTGFGVLAVTAVAATTAKAADKPAGGHRIVIQVSDNRPEIMTMALNNAANVSSAYADKGEEVLIEIVAYGPGLHMLRTETSPVKDRIASFPKSMPNVSFSACGNTLHAMEKMEGRPVALISEAKVVPAGVVRIMELQEQGWSYIKV